MVQNKHGERSERIFNRIIVAADYKAQRCGVKELKSGFCHHVKPRSIKFGIKGLSKQMAASERRGREWSWPGHGLVRRGLTGGTEQLEEIHPHSNPQSHAAHFCFPLMYNFVNKSSHSQLGFSLYTSSLSFTPGIKGVVHQKIKNL